MTAKKGVKDAASKPQPVSGHHTRSKSRNAPAFPKRNARNTPAARAKASPAKSQGRSSFQVPEASGGGARVSTRLGATEALAAYAAMNAAPEISKVVSVKNAGVVKPSHKMTTRSMKAAVEEVAAKVGIVPGSARAQRASARASKRDQALNEQLDPNPKSQRASRRHPAAPAPAPLPAAIAGPGAPPNETPPSSPALINLPSIAQYSGFISGPHRMDGDGQIEDLVAAGIVSNGTPLNAGGLFSNSPAPSFFLPASTLPPLNF